MNSRFRPYRIILPRQGGSINIIQVTVYSFTVPALKLMNVKFCLFLATTAHCHDRAAIKFISQLLIALIYMCAAETYTILIVFGYPYLLYRKSNLFIPLMDTFAHFKIFALAPLLFNVSLSQFMESRSMTLITV